MKPTNLFLASWGAFKEMRTDEDQNTEEKSNENEDKEKPGDPRINNYSLPCAN